jgi:carboxyl-terminal processing protease
MGFRAMYIEGKWTVTRSDLSSLKPGDVIASIGSESVESLFQKQKRYLNASNEHWARSIFFNRRYLFPQAFELTLEGGRKVTIDRKPKPKPAELKTEGKWVKADSIAYIKVPSFDAPEFEQTAIQLVKKYHTAKSLIIDLRGNGGGSTPGELIDGLMDRPYRGSTQATPLSLAVIKTRGGFFDKMKQDPSAKKDETYGYMEAMKEMSDNVQLLFPSRPQEPENTLYKGSLFVLIDRDVFSAGEDFCIPFKDNHRAVFLGETTGGSTGQPYFYLFSNGSGFRVSAKRDSFPDGAPFEGIGVAPDVVIPTTQKSLAANRDDVLERAIALAAAQPTSHSR